MLKEIVAVNIDGSHLIREEDVPYEEELLRNPYTVKPWLRYIRHKEVRPMDERVYIYERACRDLPGSYKLWKLYLDSLIEHINVLNPAKYAAEYDKVNNAFERAFVLLNKMPVIWLDYLFFLMKQCKVTYTRRAFDQALRALPLTQHHKIWKLYRSFAKSAGGMTAFKIGKRFHQLEPEYAEDFIELLIDQGFYNEAAHYSAEILNNPKFISREGKSHFQLWTEFTELLIRHPHEIEDIPVERVIRSGLVKFSDQRGKLWTNLATYMIAIGDMEGARDIFEEAISTVLTVRDFTQVYDAYAEFEESIISLKMEAVDEHVDDPDYDLELDLRMLRLEQLMDRRSFLVNDVLLRQNPNNVIEWERRAVLWGDNLEQVVQTYHKAIATIKPKKSTGRYSHLWISFAKSYEKICDLKNARIILEKATNVPYKTADELADVWREYAELELRNDNIEQARQIMAKATKGPPFSTVDYFDETLTPQARVHKSIKLWSFYIDLEESSGTIESTRSIYDRVFELRIATPQVVVNYANFLHEHGYYEESFKIFERGIDLFSYPVAFELWNLYLVRFLKRYGGTKLERARDLFEQALEGCPDKFAKQLYLLYANLEEEHGLAQHAMNIYERAIKAVAEDDRLEMYRIYIAKTAENFGLIATRPVYEKAIEALPDKQACEICLEFAEMERRLGEVERARVLYAYGSQFAYKNEKYWKIWQDFETKYGDEETYKDMLRIKRTIDQLHGYKLSGAAPPAVQEEPNSPS